MTGVAPAVSVAHLMMAAFTPLAPMPWVMSRTKRSATASTSRVLKKRGGIHQTPVATMTCTRDRRAPSTMRSMSPPRSTVVRSTIVRMPRAWRSAILRSATARISARFQRCGQFSCTPGERVTMCSCISVGPSSDVATAPRAVSTTGVMARGLTEELLAHLEPGPGGEGERFHVDPLVVAVEAWGHRLGGERTGEQPEAVGHRALVAEVRGVREAHDHARQEPGARVVRVHHAAKHVPE